MYDSVAVKTMTAGCVVYVCGWQIFFLLIIFSLFFLQKASAVFSSINLFSLRNGEAVGVQETIYVRLNIHVTT